jgi:hypothetical protein
MEANSPKPPQTGFDQFNGIKVLREWLDREGGNQKIPQVLDLMTEHAARAWASGQPTPTVDADTLRQLHADAYGGRLPDTPASRWLLSSQVQTWWDARQGSLEHAFRTARMGAIPMLTIIPGGGRGNPTLYRLDFEPLPMFDEGADEFSSVEANAAQTKVIRYQIEPAKAAWWLQPIIGNTPFRMRSARGYCLLGLVLLEALVLLAGWGLLLLIFRGSRSIQISDVGLLLTLFALTWTWWHFMQPLIRLPNDRVTIANDLLLGWSQLNGQFRLTRDAKSKVAGGWFQLVRHWGTCPLCAGEVEIAAGGQAFPGRLVGRCSDSPIEHVFSFDPVSRSGSFVY